MSIQTMSRQRRQNLTRLVMVGIAIAGILSLGSCGLLGFGASDLSVSFRLADSSAPSAQALTTNPEWTVAEARITEIVFDHDIGDDSVSYTEPTVSTVNLITGESEPPLPSYTLEPGTYKSLNFGAELLDNGTDPSIKLEGSWNGQDIRVIFKSGEVFESFADELIVEPGQEYAIEVVLDPDQWFSTMSDSDLENADTGADGVIEISPTANDSLYDAHFAPALDQSTQVVFPGGTVE